RLEAVASRTADGRVLREVDLARRDELELYVAELDDVTGVEDRAFELHPVHAHAVRAVLVDDFVLPAVDQVDLGVDAAHGGVVHRQVTILAAPDHDALV